MNAATLIRADFAEGRVSIATPLSRALAERKAASALLTAAHDDGTEAHIEAAEDRYRRSRDDLANALIALGLTQAEAYALADGLGS